jgi:hypothetical protein
MLLSTIDMFIVPPEIKNAKLEVKNTDDGVSFSIVL